MSPVHVAVAAIVNSQQEVLIALRPAHVHQGGLWEFPGGKVEQNESAPDALHREIYEELGLRVDSMTPLIQVRYDYADKSVLLDVWRVERFEGEPRGMEGQPVRWQKISELDESLFPSANQPIIRALQLPELYMITGRFDRLDDFENRLEQALQDGVRLVQLRARHITAMAGYLELAEKAYALCEQWQARLLLNTSVDIFNYGSAHGLHLNSRDLFNHSCRPVDDNKLLSVSCHNEQELHQAKLIAADLVLLSPVKPTSSHPGVPGMGWNEFRRLAQTVSCPVYALGGMQLSDLRDAKNAGAQGIAAISSLWNDE